MRNQMKVDSEPFKKILSGEKVIESRLLDEKRRLIRIGDEIDIIENDNPSNIASIVVTEIYRYKTFEELFASHEPALFGGDSREFLLKEIKQFYSDEDEEINGVIGIRFTLKRKNNRG